MELKGRLKLIAKKVPLCETVCDIGTDHAYVPIYLILNKICKKAIATDVKQGPVYIANKNIKKYKLEDVIETRIGNGLDCIKEHEADTIIVAGMGGILIREILYNGFEKAKTACSLILQPMNAIEVVREWLMKNGYNIYDEELVNEGEKIYNVISATWTGQIKDTDKVYHYIGEKLIENNDPLLTKYIDKKLKQMKRIINGLKNSNSTSKEIEKYNWLYYQIKRLQTKRDT